jgi:hypothetical protein
MTRAAYHRTTSWAVLNVSLARAELALGAARSLLPDDSMSADKQVTRPV